MASKVYTSEQSIGVTFKIAVAPSADADEVLKMTQDPENACFDVRQINIGNEEFTLALGRTVATNLPEGERLQ